MKNRRRSYRLVVASAAVLLLSSISYLAFVVVTNSGPKAKLRHALDLKALPSSVEIVGHGGESWTDYLFVADLRVAPDQLPELLKGRDFVPCQQRPGTTHESWIPDFQPLSVAEGWQWQTDDKDGSPFARCTIQTNTDRTRVLVRYVSD